MAVRAKVRCNAKTQTEVHFTTVYEPDASKDSENARFTKATPWGDIKMGIDNPAAMEQFEVNKEYYVDFSPVKAVLFLACLALGFLFCSEASAGNRCNVNVAALQSGLVVTPFAVPVATPVAVANVSPFAYGFSSAQSYGASSYSAQGTSAASVASLEDRIAAKVVAQLRAGGVTAQGTAGELPPPPTLLSTNCAKCHTGENAKGGFRVDQALSADLKLHAVAKILEDDATKRMPKGKNLDPATLGKLIQELSKPVAVAKEPEPE